MNRLKKNNKGFTLIELLAVIVILGVLMIIAIPMVSKYIKQAKQNAFIDTAKAYVSSARYGYLNGDYTEAEATDGNCATLDSGGSQEVYIKFKYIAVDKAGGQSSFGKTIDKDKSFVKIVSNADGRYTYFVYMEDKGGNRLSGLMEEDKLMKNHVVTSSSSSVTIDSSKSCKGTDYSSDYE